MNFQNLVKEFMLTASQQFPIENKEELAKVLEERKGYLLEEIKELETAIENNDRVEQLDAICDVVYVDLGDALVSNEVVSQDELFDVGDVNFEDAIFFMKRFSTHNDGACSQSAIEVSNHLGFTLETIQEAFKRVHESNMSKFCKTKKEADQTQSHYYYSLDTKTYIEENNGYYVVKRASDNKVLKSVNYKRVDLTDLV